MKGGAECWGLRPSYEECEAVAKKVNNESERELLAWKYMYLSGDMRKSVLTTVGDILQSAVEQRDNYMRILKLGEPKSLYHPRILDSCIRVGVGNDALQGHAIMAIGGRRTLVRSTEVIRSDKHYQSVVRY